MFSQFTDSDWSAFSGCTSENPEIFCGAGFTVILDGKSVEFILDDDGPSWNREYPNAEISKGIATALAASPTRGSVEALLDPFSDGSEDYPNAFFHRGLGVAAPTSGFERLLEESVKGLLEGLTAERSGRTYQARDAGRIQAGYAVEVVRELLEDLSI